MEKIRREIRLFCIRHGKSFFKIIGFIFAVIFVLQTLDNIAKQKKEREQPQIYMQQAKIQKEQKQKVKEAKDKQFILTFIEYCNDKKVVQAYELLSEECKYNKYQTIQEFEQKYINKVFNNKKDVEINIQENNIYKITFLKDLLQAGALENREELEDYYTIKEDVLGNKTININLYNNI